jgi:hypothetical protein
MINMNKVMFLLGIILLIFGLVFPFNPSNFLFFMINLTSIVFGIFLLIISVKENPKNKEKSVDVKEVKQKAIKEEIKPKDTYSFSSSDWLGDVERASGKMALALAQLASDAAQGIIQENIKIGKLTTPKFIQNIKDKLGTTSIENKTENKLKNISMDIALYRDSIGKEIRKEGGVGAEWASAITDWAAQTAATLAIMNVGTNGLKLTGDSAKQALTSAAKMFTMGYVTTPGDESERIQAGADWGIRMLLPIPARRLPNDLMAKLALLVANFGVSAIGGQYKSA